MVKAKLSKRLLTVWLPNLFLVIGIILLIKVGLGLAAFGLLAVSKWQIARGGRKLWLRNLRDGALDIVVGVSAVSLMVIFNHDLLIQVTTAAIYYLWLAVLKPLTGHVSVAVQSGFCQIIGLWVVFLLARRMPAAAVIILAWGIALVAADHLLSAHHERTHAIITLAWGLLVAEASWLFWHWLIVYSFFNQRLLVPQAPLVIGLVGYIFGSMYLDHTRAKLGKRRLVEYVVLGFGLCAVLIFGSQWDMRL